VRPSHGFWSGHPTVQCYLRRGGVTSVMVLIVRYRASAIRRAPSLNVIIRHISALLGLRSPWRGRAVYRYVAVDASGFVSAARSQVLCAQIEGTPTTFGGVARSNDEPDTWTTRTSNDLTYAMKRQLPWIVCSFDRSEGPVFNAPSMAALVRSGDETGTGCCRRGPFGGN
jgi:hypothetical protein